MQIIAQPECDLFQHAQRLLDEGACRTERPCKVCGEGATRFDVLDFALTCNSPRAPRGLSGAPVYYHRCHACHFVFTEFCDSFTPAQWTTHVYDESYYHEVDPDYGERRPQANAQVINALLANCHEDWLGLDYGGGNGLTAALIREMGYRYECFDPFGSSDVSVGSRGLYNFCSVFEVAEHAPDPGGFTREIVDLCSKDRLAVLVGTHVNDRHVTDDGRLDWWYAAPRNGHISLHSRRSLQLLAHAQGLDCLNLSEQTHLFSRGYTQKEALAFLLTGKIRARWHRAVSVASRMIALTQNGIRCSWPKR